MVEGELFPAIRKFGLRFYAYNPVSFFVYLLPAVTMVTWVCFILAGRWYPLW